MYFIKLMCGRPKVFFSSVANFRKDEGENLWFVLFMGICVSLSDTIVDISEEHFQASKHKLSEDFSFSDRRERLPSFDSFHCKGSPWWSQTCP